MRELFQFSYFSIKNTILLNKLLENISFKKLTCWICSLSKSESAVIIGGTYMEKGMYIKCKY